MPKMIFKYDKTLTRKHVKNMPKKHGNQTPTPHEQLFKSTTAKIIDHFLTFNTYEYSKTEIAQATQTSLRTIIRELPNLEKNGIIIHTRSIGQAEMYQTNNQNPIIQHLQKTQLLIAQNINNQTQQSQQETEKQSTILKQPILTVQA
jgi:DNA-binding transcriptional regulator YhcF (GntR family)